MCDLSLCVDIRVSNVFISLFYKGKDQFHYMNKMERSSWDAEVAGDTPGSSSLSPLWMSK